MKQVVSIFLVSILIIQCRPFREDVILKIDDAGIPADIQRQLYEAETTYKISRGDFLNLRVFTNKGELIIDPNFQLRRETGGMNVRETESDRIRYLVNDSGFVKFPILDEVKLIVYSLEEAENILEEGYSEYYKEPFVRLNYLNKRVIVLGAPGGQIIRLENERMNLLEVLALAGGLDRDAIGNNIRIIRGNLTDPEVFVVDLSTIEGMEKSILPIYPDDIIYVEPKRRVVLEQVSYLAPIVSLLTSVTALVLVITNL
jgi:polysaccharide export outer membrane protein